MGILFQVELFGTGSCEKLMRDPIIDKCIGCARIIDGKCEAYAFPAAVWRRGCPLATHVKLPVKRKKGKVRVGQQKQQRKC